MRPLLFPILMPVVIIILVGAFAVWRRARAAREDRTDPERERMFKEAVDKKILLPDGRKACVVCGTVEATEPWPLIKRSWLDGITLFKDLYALTPRYEIRDGMGESYEGMLCRHHKRMCVQKWNEFLAAKRNQVQRLFSDIEGELAQMEGHAMLAYLQKQHDESLNSLDTFLGTSGPKQLTRGSEDDDLVQLPNSGPTETE